MSKLSIYKYYGIALTATFGLLFIYLFLNNHFDGSIWQTMIQSKSGLVGEYCELDKRMHFFRQTMNTYSNLLYFFLGMLVVLISFHDRKHRMVQNKNLLQQFPLLSFLFGCCLMYLCFASSFFHASLTWIGQRADMNATYSICITLTGISSYRLYMKEKQGTVFRRIFILTLLLAMLFFIELHLLISSSILLPLLIMVITVNTVILYLSSKNTFILQPAILSLLLMTAAFILRTLDVKKIGCNPVSVYQGHALWHFFTGMSAFLLYWFYRNEKA